MRLKHGHVDQVTGHSLGGGLAASIAIRMGIRGTTFNAAGVNSATVGGGLYESKQYLVRNYRVWGEFLSGLQNGPDVYIDRPALGSLMPNSAGRQLILRRRSVGGHGLSSDVIPSLEDLLR